jgi:hypothetical protein
MASPMGPIPVGLFRRRFAGTDVFAVTAWLMLAGAHGTVVAIVLAVTLIAYALTFTARGR